MPRGSAAGTSKNMTALRRVRLTRGPSARSRRRPRVASGGIHRREERPGAAGGDGGPARSSARTPQMRPRGGHLTSAAGSSGLERERSLERRCTRSVSSTACTSTCWATSTAVMSSRRPRAGWTRRRCRRQLQRRSIRPRRSTQEQRAMDLARQEGREKAGKKGRVVET